MHTDTFEACNDFNIVVINFKKFTSVSFFFFRQNFSFFYEIKKMLLAPLPVLPTESSFKQDPAEIYLLFVLLSRISNSTNYINIKSYAKTDLFYSCGRKSCSASVPEI